MIDTILHGQTHWIWIPVALSFGSCIGYVTAKLLRNIEPGGNYYPSVEDAEHLYRPRNNVTHWKPRVEK